MTIQQLRYIVTVAETGSISRAAEKLFITQPSLTASIHELERELGITVFSRTNKGVILSLEGEEFLAYARQALTQVELIEEKYKGGSSFKHLFCISAQHYSFAVEAFVDLVREYGGDSYDFRIRETQTWEIIEDVSTRRSEVGILYLNKDNEKVIRRLLGERGLKFTRLFVARPHVFVGKNNPLAKKEKIRLSDLEDYPRLSYEQGEHNAFYFSEEIQSTRESRKDIMVRDRATLFNLLLGVDGYTISSGVINSELNGPDILSVPLDLDDYMDIGYVVRSDASLSHFAESYLRFLKERTADKGSAPSD